MIIDLIGKFHRLMPIAKKLCATYLKETVLGARPADGIKNLIVKLDARWCHHVDLKVYAFCDTVIPISLEGLDLD